MQPKHESKKDCKELAKDLSKIGLHGSNVHIKKDEKSLVLQVMYHASLALVVQRQENFFLHHVMRNVRLQLDSQKDLMDWKKYIIQY